MTPTYHRWLVLAAAAAVLATPAAAVAGSAKPAPDWFERHVAAHPYGPTVSRPIDLRSAATLDAAAHVRQASLIRIDGRSADTLDAAANSRQASLTPSDGRSPDAQEAASAPQPVVRAQPGDFDWGDAGIGAGFAGGLLVVLAAAASLWLRHHPRRQVRIT
jgi:hypothetical protein